MINNLNVEFESHTQRKFAYVVIVLIIIICIITIPVATTPLVEVKAFLPMFASFVMLTEFLTAYHLMVQFTITRQFFLIPLAGAYAFVAVMVIIQLLTFPGIFAQEGILGGNNQSALWMWVFWHGAYAGLICISLVFQRLSIDKTVSRHEGFGMFLLAPALAVLLALVALESNSLPILIVKGSYQALSHSIAGFFVWGISFTAVLLAIDSVRHRKAVGIFILIAVLASLADVTLTLIANYRYSLGWYVSRILSIVSSLSVLIGLLLQVTRLYQNLAIANEVLIKTATSDGLTGIANRRRFNEVAQKEWLRSLRTKEPLSVIIVDIDHFKTYNDHFGHQQGDECLIAIAVTLAQNAKRPSDLCARYGGEEFVFILPNTSLAGAKLIAEHARKAVIGLGLPTKNPNHVVTISAGCATWTNGSTIDSFAVLLKLADDALYQSKALGRNVVSTIQ